MVRQVKAIRAASASGPIRLCGLSNNLAALLRGVDPGNFRIVSENGEPLPGNRVRVVTLAALDYLEGKQIVSHYPGDVEMPGCGNEIRNIAGGLAAALDENGHHIARVT